MTTHFGSDETVRLVVEASPGGMIMTNAAGEIVLVNTQAERISGYVRSELIGKRMEMLVPLGICGEHSQLRNAYHAHAASRAVDGARDLYIVRKDGTELPVEIGLNPISTPDGGMVLSAIVDISERRRSERILAKHSEELQRSNADLEQFAYIASHDLQEPLRMVTTYTELLSEHYKDCLDEKTAKYIHHARDGARRMKLLINDLLAYARIDTQLNMLAPTDSNVVLKDVLDGLAIAIADNRAEIICERLPIVYADCTQLAQVFQNLIENALKFHGDEPLHIRIAAERRGDNWVFRIEDNGIGIDEQYAEVVFQMFKRLHQRGCYEGSGIGLAMVKKIVERHDGRVWFNSASGKGTAFHFTLPVTQGHLA